MIVFFSAPVDLDLMTLDAYPKAYEINRSMPEESTIIAVLGKSHANEDRIGDDLLELFDDYHAKFELGSKPASAPPALSALPTRSFSRDSPTCSADSWSG